MDHRTERADYASDSAPGLVYMFTMVFTLILQRCFLMYTKKALEQFIVITEDYWKPYHSTKI